jgi:hypothetical protein
MQAKILHARSLNRHDVLFWFGLSSDQPTAWRTLYTQTTAWWCTACTLVAGRVWCEAIYLARLLVMNPARAASRIGLSDSDTWWTRRLPEMVEPASCISDHGSSIPRRRSPSSSSRLLLLQTKTRRTINQSVAERKKRVCDSVVVGLRLSVAGCRGAAADCSVSLSKTQRGGLNYTLIRWCGWQSGDKGNRVRGHRVGPGYSHGRISRGFFCTTRGFPYIKNEAGTR